MVGVDFVAGEEVVEGADAVPGAPRAEEVADEDLLAEAEEAGSNPEAALTALREQVRLTDKPDDDLLQRLEKPYDGEVAYLDSEVGRLFDGLAARGLLENTVLAIVADRDADSWDEIQLWQQQVGIDLRKTGTDVQDRRNVISHVLFMIRRHFIFF